MRRASRKICCPSTTWMPCAWSAKRIGSSTMSTPSGSFASPNFSSSRLTLRATSSAIPASGGKAPRSVEMPARAPDSVRGRVAPWCGACGWASASMWVSCGRGWNRSWWLAAEAKSRTVGSEWRVTRQKRMSLSIAHVPMCVAEAYRMLAKSNARSAPTSDLSSWARSFARRSSRSRAKSTRASQSTPMLPRVAMLICFSSPCPGPSGDAPAAIDVETVRRDAAVEQQELGRVDDVGDGRELSARGAVLVQVEHTLGLRGPERGVADDPGVQRVDPDGRELEREGVHDAVDPAVDRRDRGRAGVRGVLGPPPEEHDARVDARGEPVEQGVHGRGVADELERHEAAGPLDRVLADRVRVALDRAEHEAVDARHARERVRDRLGLGDVDGHAGRALAERRGDLVGRLLAPARDDHAVTARDEVLGERQADARRSADDEDGPLAHSSSSSRSVRYSQSRTKR